jgi:hypothetical protein
LSSVGPSDVDEREAELFVKFENGAPAVALLRATQSLGRLHGDFDDVPLGNPVPLGKNVTLGTETAAIFAAIGIIPAETMIGIARVIAVANTTKTYP